MDTVSDLPFKLQVIKQFPKVSYQNATFFLSNPKERLVIGSICIDEDKWQEDVEYQLEVEKENGDKFWVPIMIKTWERNNGKVNADFFVTEETDLKYEYLTILKGQEELVKFELKK